MQILLDDLKINERNHKTAILFRILTAPYIHSASTTIVEDVSGNVARLTVCNLEDSMVDPILLESSVVAVKQPCWSALADGGYQIRVDHPCDLVFLEEGSEDVPEEWRTEAVDEGGKEEGRDSGYWRKEGDRMFLTKKFRRALDWYDSSSATYTWPILVCP